MRLCGVEIGPSPDRPETTRLTGMVTLGRSGAPEPYWFEVPSEIAPVREPSGNPWLACLLPLAFWLGEPLEIGARIDRRLRESVDELLRVWHGWFPGHLPIDVRAPVSEGPGDPAMRTCSLFSGGVDSFFTVLRRESVGFDSHLGPIDELLHVWGFDYPSSAFATFSHVRSRLEPAAAEFGKPLVVVRTNLRETRWQATPWATLSHGCALAAAALVLEERYGTALIPATHTTDWRGPWGSAPRTDPLLSTDRTRIVHDGADRSRVEKTRVVARSSVALGALRVCYRHGASENCGACSKCLRTMATLELLGALDRCPTLGPAPLDLDRLAHVFAIDRNAEDFLREVRELALALDRTDVARALDTSLHRSHRLRPAFRLCECLKHVPWAWRWVETLERRLLSGSFV